MYLIFCESYMKRSDQKSTWVQMGISRTVSQML